MALISTTPLTTSLPVSTTVSVNFSNAALDASGKSTLNVFEHWLQGVPPVKASSIRSLYPLMIPILFGLKPGEDPKNIGVIDIEKPLDEYDFIIGTFQLYCHYNQLHFILTNIYIFICSRSWVSRVSSCVKIVREPRSLNIATRSRHQRQRSTADKHTDHVLLSSKNKHRLAVQN